MDPLLLIGRVFNNEPLERVMYLVVIWVSLLLLTPESWGAYVNSYVGIPHTWQLFIFAASYLLALNSQRFLAIIRDDLKSRNALKFKDRRKQEIKGEVSGLPDGEREYLAMMVSSGKEFTGGKPSNPSIASLVERGIIHDSSKHLSMRYSGMYKINPEYYSECIRQLSD